MMCDATGLAETGRRACKICGKPIGKGRRYCDQCRDERRRESYARYVGRKGGYFLRRNTPEWASEARLLWEGGEHRATIADRFGVSEATIHVHSRSAGWDKRKRNYARYIRQNPWVLEARNMYERGETMRGIGKCFGVSENTVAANRDRWGWSTVAHELAKRRAADGASVTRVCSKCGMEKPTERFAKSSARCRVCRKECKRERRRRDGALTWGAYVAKCRARAAERNQEAAERRERNRRSRAALSPRVQAAVLALLADEPEAANLPSSTLRYRARYRYDPEFRAKEILRRHARDYDMESDGTLTGRHVQHLFANARACAYCGELMESRGKTMDHIIPRSRGGMHSASNVVICCLSCNSSKGARTPKEWRDAA